MCFRLTFAHDRSPQTLPISVPLKQDATIIGLVGLAHASSHFGHLLLPPLFPVFMAEFGLSYSQLGALMSVFFVVSGIGQASAGFVVDKVGRPAHAVCGSGACLRWLRCWPPR